MGVKHATNGSRRPWNVRCAAPSLRHVRIVVLWNACRGTSREEDARWVEEEAACLRSCGGVRAATLQPVRSASPCYPRPWDWCLELELEAPPQAVLADPLCACFLGDLRLLGTRPTVLALPEAALR